jgi:HSP20 family protein
MVHASTPTRVARLFPKSLDRDMSELFDAFFNGGKQAEAPLAQQWYAPAALWEAEDAYYVEVDLPGVKREDVELTLDKNVLRIAAERKTPAEERKYWHSERGYGRVERTISLPEKVDHDAIEAELSDGVLVVKLVKRPELLPKKIEIKA